MNTPHQLQKHSVSLGEVNTPTEHTISTPTTEHTNSTTQRENTKSKTPPSPLPLPLLICLSLHHTYTHMHTDTHITSHTHTHTHIHTYAHTHIHTHTHTHTHIRAYTHTHIHTYAHMQHKWQRQGSAPLPSGAAKLSEQLLSNARTVRQAVQRGPVHQYSPLHQFVKILSIEVRRM